ncbi:MAG: FG-GAP-like repeat-containing protein, partial [Planctomycetaceae bacterium]
MLSDVDQDGDLDVVATNFSHNTVTTYLNDGAARLALSARLPIGMDLGSLAVGDIDGDTIPDAVVSLSSRGISILTGNGDGSFRESHRITGIGTRDGILLVDLDGDNDNDIVVTTSDGVATLMGDGHGGFATSVHYDAGISFDNQGVATADIDGDGSNDIVLSNYYEESVSVLLNKGDGRFLQAQRFGAGDAPGGIVIVDLDQDGHTELVVANELDDTITVVAGRQATGLMRLRENLSSVVGEISAPGFGYSEFGGSLYFFSGGHAGNPVELSRFNGQTLELESLALVSTASSFDRPQSIFWKGGLLYFTMASGMMVYEDGIVSEVPVDSSTVSFEVIDNGTRVFSFGMQLGDINGDGVDDIIGTSTIGTLLSTGDGIFVNRLTHSLPSYSRLTDLQDVDGDGLLDAFVTNLFDNTLRVLFSNGDGSFEETVFVIPDLPLAVGVGDIDSDGVKDILVSVGDDRFEGGALYTLRNNGDRDFTDAIACNCIDDAQGSILIEDINGDSHADVIVGSDFQSVSVMLGSGDGLLQDAVRYSTANVSSGGAPRDVILSDLNGDEIADLIVARSSTGVGLTTFLGVGDGAFIRRTEYTLPGINHYFLTIAELDGDGFDDIIVVRDSKASILVGAGDGMFSSGQQFDIGNTSGGGVAVSDVSGDGRLDIIASLPQDNEVRVFLGEGDASFGEALTVLRPDDPSSLFLSDQDNDGLDDIIVANKVAIDGQSFVTNVITLLSRPKALVPTASVRNGENIVAISDGNLIMFSPDGANGVVIDLNPAQTRDGVLLRSAYQVSQIVEFENQIAAVVHLRDSEESDIFLIDPVTGAVESLLLESNLRISSESVTLHTVIGDTLYLSAEVIGSRTGSELLSFTRGPGLSLVADVLPGIESSEIQGLIEVDGALYFTALSERVDNLTGLSGLVRDLFIIRHEDDIPQPVRAGRQTSGALTSVGGDVLFTARRSLDSSDVLWSVSTQEVGVSDIGAAELVHASITGTAFLDIDGDSLLDSGDPRRAGVSIFVDVNGNGQFDGSEPLSLTRFDDRSTSFDETGSYRFDGLLPGTYRLRAVPSDGFSQTTPLTISTASVVLSEVERITTVGINPDLTLPTLVGDDVFYGNLADNALKHQRSGEEATSIVTDQTVVSNGSPLRSLGGGHAQDGNKVVFTGILQDGVEFVASVDSVGGVTVHAQTRTPLTIPTATLQDIEDEGNGGFDSLSIAGDNIGFLGVSNSSGGQQHYFLGASGRFEESQHAQVLLSGNDEVIVDRVIDGSPTTVLTGSDLFEPKAALDSRLGGNTGWKITSGNGVEIFPLTFIDRIFDVSVAGLTAVFRAIDASGLDAIYVANVDTGLTRVVDTTTPVPGDSEVFTRFGSITNSQSTPSLSIDGDNFVFVGGVNSTVGLYGRINGSLRKIVDGSDFTGRTLSDLKISHQALSGNAVVFHASFTNGTESIFRGELPADSVATITVEAGETVENLDFGARAFPGIIRGMSFLDIDADGVFDTNEGGNTSRTVFLDANLNGLLDDSEISTTTNENGDFVFTDLPAETDYVVREVLPAGFAATTHRTLEEATVRLPAAGSLQLMLGSVEESALGDSADGVVRGVVFQDVNGNGVQDPTEPGMGGRTVFVDENGDGVLNGGERSATTDTNGAYVINQLSGIHQAVRVALPDAATEQTSPRGNDFQSSTLRTIDSPVEVVTGDFNGDGRDDIAATIDKVNEVRMFFNDGAGGFTDGGSVEVAAEPGSIAVGIFGGPGSRPGIVVGHNTSNRVEVLLPRAGGSYAAFDLVVPQDVQSGGRFDGLETAPYFVTTGDFNNDGRDDIAVVSQNNASPDGGVVGIFLSNGDESFSLEQLLILPKARADFPTAVTAGHVVGGVSTVDLVIANSATPQNVTVLSNTGNDGSGRFVIDGHWPIGGKTPTSVQIGDLNNDGFNDIVTTNLRSNNVSVLKNNQSDGFSQVTLLPAGQGPAYARLVDLDQNGSTDIAFTNSETETGFGILRNNGDGTFQAAATSGVVRFPDGTVASSLAIGRFNDDNADGTIDEFDLPDVTVSNRSTSAFTGDAGALKVGVNSLVAGAQHVDLFPGTRTATDLDFGLRALNLLPSFDAIADPSAIDEDAEQQSVNVTGITTGGEEEQLQVTVNSSNTDLVDPTISANAATGTATIRYTPERDHSGSVVVTVSVSDAGANGVFGDDDDGVVSQTFNVVVNPVNDLPTVNRPVDVVLNEEASEQTITLSGIVAGGGETQPLRLSVTSSNSSLIEAADLTYSSPAATGTLRFTPVGDASGTATISITVEDAGLDGDLNTQDDNGRSQPVSFQVTVNAVNDPPQLNSIPNLDLTASQPAGSAFLSGIVAGGGEAQPLRITATSGNRQLIPDPAVVYQSPDASGLLQVGSVSDRFGSATITVTVTDGGLDGDLNTADDNATFSQTFMVTVTDGRDAGFTLSKTAATVSESGTTETFTVVLNRSLQSDVVLDVRSLDTTEATVTPATITFTPDNWNIVQTVTITGEDDDLVDDDQNSSVAVSINQASSDNQFDMLPNQTVAVTTTDDDVAGFTASKATVVVNESGTSDSFTVVLDHVPLTNVVLKVVSADTGEAEISPDTITFTPGTWDIAQTVVVTGVDDSVIDSHQNTKVSVSIDTAASDNAFDDVPDRDVTVVTIDNDAAGFTLSQSELVVSETGTAETFAVVLNRAPAADVVLNVDSGNTAEAEVTPSTVTFTPDNWITAQIVTITGMDDNIVDGDRDTTVTVSINKAGSDDAFDLLPDQTVTVTTTDDDVAGFTISKTTASVSESGTTDTFTVVLDRAPLSDVVLNVHSSDFAEATVTQTPLTFTTNNWNTVQTVTITGMDDNIVDGDRDTTVTVSINKAGSDDAFDLLPDQTVTVTTTDDDVAGFTISKTTASVSESGTTDTFTVVLDRAPVSDVVLSLVSDNTDEVTVSPATVTFNSDNWNTAQTVTVTGADDNIVDGNTETNVTISINKAASDNAFDLLPGQTVTVTTSDNDTAAPTSGDVDGDADFDANDSFLIHLVKLSGTDAQINQSKGSSVLTAAQIRSVIDQLGIATDVDGDDDFDANDSFLIHLVKLSGTNAQIDQSKGSSQLSAGEIRSNVASLGNVSSSNAASARESEVLRA